MRLTSRRTARSGKYDVLVRALVYHKDVAGDPAVYRFSEDRAKNADGLLLSVEDIAIGVSQIGGLLEINRAAIVLDDTRGLVRGWLTNDHQKDLKGALVVLFATTPEDIAAPDTPNLLIASTQNGTDFTGWDNPTPANVTWSNPTPGLGFTGTVLQFACDGGSAGQRSWTPSGAMTQGFILGHTYRIAFKYRAPATFKVEDRDIPIATVPANTGNAVTFTCEYTKTTQTFGGLFQNLLFHFANATGNFQLDDLIVQDVTGEVLFRGQITDYPSAGDYEVRLELQDVGGQRTSRRIQLPTVGASFANCPPETAAAKAGLPFGELTDVGWTNNGVVPGIHVGNITDDFGNTLWHGFALACVECSEVKEIYINGVAVAAGTFLDPGATMAAPGHGDYNHYFLSQYRDTGDGIRWTLVYVWFTHPDLAGLVDGSKVLTANVVGARTTGRGYGALKLTDQMKQFADNFLLPKTPFNFIGDWAASIPTYDDGTPMRADAPFDAADADAADEIHADTAGGFMITDDFDVLDWWAKLCDSADCATGFTEDGQLSVWLESELLRSIGTTYDDLEDIATLAWQERMDPSWYFNVANYQYMQVFGTRGGAEWQHIYRSGDTASIGDLGEIWAPNPISLFARRNVDAAQALIQRKALRSAKPRRVATIRVPFPNLTQPLMDNIRITDARGVGAAGYSGQWVQTRSRMTSVGLGAVDLEVRDLLTNHADHVDHTDHGDHDDHADHTDHADVGHADHSDHEDHQDHQDDYWINFETRHDDHVDFDDHADSIHSDHLDHTDHADHTDNHTDHADTHFDHSDHDDHTDQFPPESPHGDHDDHDDHTDHGDHTDNHTDHADHTDHLDIAGHADHTDHADATPHTDHDDHTDHY